MLGARLIVEEGEDVAELAIATARSLGTTYLLMGSPSPRRGLKRFRESLLTRLLEALPGVDVRVVADPVLREETSTDVRASLNDRYER
jgi:two-component system, OmpR family, sensor histidine kinase KdpD